MRKRREKSPKGRRRKRRLKRTRRAMRRRREGTETSQSGPTRQEPARYFIISFLKKNISIFCLSLVKRRVGPGRPGPGGGGGPEQPPAGLGDPRDGKDMLPEEERPGCQGRGQVSNTISRIENENRFSNSIFQVRAGDEAGRDLPDPGGAIHRERDLPAGR